jgi:DNA polymerase-4
MSERIILHIDFNSYFASAEQQCNPFLRGKPIAIGGSPGSRSVIVACSIEAKQYGLKTAMPTSEALALCPHLMFIDGDPVKYQELTQQFINIGKRYSDRIDVYSVDELFMDLTGWVNSYEQAIDIAKHLKSDLKKEIGDYLTCSIGIAPNRMMSKLASAMQKPDGLTVIPPDTLREVLDWVELTEVPGIGSRLKIRFFDLGIRTLRQLGDHPIEALQREFGPNNGIILSEMGKGIDTTEVPYIDETAPAKSIGHTYTLSQDTKSRDEIYRVLLRLSEKVGRRLRRHKYQARRIWVYLRWEDFTGSHEGKTLKRFIDDGYEIYQIAREMLEQRSIYHNVRLVGVGTTILKQSGRQMPILEKEQKRESLLQAQDIINDKYGERAIQRGGILHTSLKRKVGGFKEPHQFH